MHCVKYPTCPFMSLKFWYFEFWEFHRSSFYWNFAGIQKKKIEINFIEFSSYFYLYLFFIFSVPEKIPLYVPLKKVVDMKSLKRNFTVVNIKARITNVVNQGKYVSINLKWSSFASMLVFFKNFIYFICSVVIFLPA